MLHKREMLTYMLTYAGEQVKARRQAVLDEIARVKEERAAQEEVEKEQLALLLRMRRAHELRERRAAEAQEEMERLAAKGVEQQQEYKDAENKKLRLEQQLALMAEGLKEKEEALERLVEERRARERDEHAGVANVQRALADLEEQVN